MNKNKGFISLTLVIVVCSLLLTFMMIESITVVEFFNSTKLKEYRNINYYNTISCIDQAVLNLSHDYFYEVTSPIRLNSFDCVIDSVSDIGGYKLVKVHGDYKNIYIRKQARVRLFDDRVEVLSIE